MYDHALLLTAAAAAVALGFVGTVLPGIPGAPLVFAGLLTAAYADDFARVGAGTLTVLGILTAVTLVVDVAAASLGAKRAGASGYAVAGSAAGTVVGLFFGPLGLFFGPLAGAVLGELYARPDVPRAGRVGLATWLGLLVGMAAKLAILVSMVGIFALKYFSAG